VNSFWADFARQAGSNAPFISRSFAEASRSFTEMMLALAVLDLPFEADLPATSFEDSAMTIVSKGLTIVCHMEVKEAERLKDAAPILVSQNLFLSSDRYAYEGAERVDKFVTDEFVTHAVYGCQVVLTNPTSSRQKLDVLLQVPRGAVPVKNGFYTRGVHVRLEPFSTTTFEYSFYFPAAGSFAHYPVHVAKDGKVVASAGAVALNVVDTPSKVDTASWDHVSQNGTPAEVLAFLDRANLYRLKLDRIAWRMRDRGFFADVLARLARRHVYDPVLWSYGLLHDEPAATREFLKHRDDLVAQSGAYLESKLLTIDPVARRSYQHLEYSPLVNPRAHAVGKRRQILNERLAAQYHALLEVLSYRAALDDHDEMALVYYLLLQDRVDEGLRFLARVDPGKLETALQYDYFRAYASFFEADRARAREIAGRYRDFPVPRWRNLFLDVLAHLDEAEGAAPTVIEPESRDQNQTKLAATEPSFEFTVEAQKVTVSYQNISRLKVSYYLMDVELLFSRNPFVLKEAGQFSFVKPNRSETIELPGGRNTFAFDLPADLRGQNLRVEIEAAGKTRAQTYFSNDLMLQVVESYGHVRVADRQSGAPLAKVYVKVYARMQDGEVKFYKDGYTDLRGRFDYSSLNTGDIDSVDRFSILVMAEKEGAQIREAEPPKQ